ncbi:glutamate--tRNA ligase family protein [Hymenobacter aerilatus]|uniref:Glutamate--tRNA ligase family protein n=1 Tax=Hymenobacter aerilatus TaxID=2932251 RepID=A0A8T9SWG8_9BACT|nr:glutamate--tRNA ligase family protein [Hymenobacter aerilatus]UOR04136.1 glutamate--tRNA ligase family protein [Hymenobacter aerilatus]
MNLSSITAPIVSRLAPTPSGYLHLGNAVNFVLTWLLTRRAGGTLHLRIDDLDRQRLRPAYLDNIFQTIEWLGLDYDHGPSGPEDFETNFSQLHHLGEYQQLLDELRQVPDLLYACRCSRTDIQRAGGQHPDATCQAQRLPLDTPETAWRAHVPNGLTIEFQDLWQPQVAVPLAADIGDFVVRKKDGVAAYQIASVVDDIRLGTTLIVRGLDLLPSTAAQLWLASQAKCTAAFGHVQFAHHALLPGADGEKLSKSTQASIQRGIMAEAGSPRVVYATVARLLGLPDAAGESLATLSWGIPNRLSS